MRDILKGMRIGLGILLMAGAGLLATVTLPTFTSGENLTAAKLTSAFVALRDGLDRAGAQPGDFKWHFTHLTGAKSLVEMQALGWVVLDGTTVESQLVPAHFSAGALALTGTLPNMINPYAGRGGLFIRAGSTTGTLQEDQFQNHRHPYEVARNGGSAAYNTGLTTILTNPGGASPLNPTNNGSTVRFGLETRPPNVTGLPLVYALK